MRALLPFLRLFKFAKLPLFLGLVLMITGLASSLTASTPAFFVSFLSACFAGLIASACLPLRSAPPVMGTFGVAFFAGLAALFSAILKSW